MLWRRDRAEADSRLWVRGKLAVVRRFGISSLRKGRELASKSKKPEQAGLAFPDYACHGGAFPIWIKVSCEARWGS